MGGLDGCMRVLVQAKIGTLLNRFVRQGGGRQYTIHHFMVYAILTLHDPSACSVVQHSA